MLHIIEMLHPHSKDRNEIYKIIIQNRHQYCIYYEVTLLSMFRNHKTEDMHYVRPQK